MDYKEFQIRAWQDGDSHAQVLVHCSPVGAMRRPVRVPCEASRLEEIRQQIEVGLWGEPGTRQRVIEAGRELARILLPPEVAALLTRSLDRVEADGLRLRLCLDETLLDAPWEFLYRSEASEQEPLDGFWVLDPRISLVREPPVIAAKLTPSDTQQRMVALGAFGVGSADLFEVDVERRRLVKALEPVAQLLYVDEQFQVAAEDQIEQSLSRPAAFFHYMGHVEIVNGRGALARAITVLNPAPDWDRSCYDLFYNHQGFSRFLQRAGVKLAFFNACNSGRWAFVEPLLKVGLPALIGIQGNISNQAAIGFCQRLYSHLAVGLSLDEAVSYARARLLDERVAVAAESCEWGAFMVYLQTAEAVLLPKPEGQPALDEQQGAARAKVRHTHDKRTLRKAIFETFEQEDLLVLCADLEQDLAAVGKDIQVDLEVVGGDTKEVKILNLINYLDRRDCLPELITAVRRERPGIKL